MSQLALTAEAKAAMIADLELELKNRKEKLMAMCDAQVASLRSRLERRVNRIPASKRNVKLDDLLDAAITTKPVGAKKDAAPIASRVPPSTRAAPTLAARKTRGGPAVDTANPTADTSKPVADTHRPIVATRKATTGTRKAATTPAEVRKPAARKEVTKPVIPKEAPKPTLKAARGTKRSSDEADENKENSTDLVVPKKRAKITPPTKPAALNTTTRTTRTTRAASRTVAASPQVLSPKPNNTRPAPRTRRPR